MGIFREYDIRGIADQDLPDSLAWALGRVLAEKILRAGDTAAYVGRDVRVSSPRLTIALSCGLEAGGVLVRRLTPGPTPLLYFAAHQSLGEFPTHSGIMVTASHNPAEYNGFKMVIAGTTLHGEEIQALEAEVMKWMPKAPTTFSTRSPEVNRESDYVANVKKSIRPGRKLRVVLDGGNGAGGPLGIASYEAIGCEVIPLYCDPDGRFPNHHPDPTVPENLRDLVALVKKEKADVGIAYDGDADRVGAVTSSGRILFGDQLVLFFSKQILKEVPGATIISEVKSSQILYDTLAKWGANPIIWKTGHSLIKAKLKETKAALAGEMSGHMFFAHGYFGFDDAIFAGAKLIEGIRQESESLDQFIESLPKAVSTPELRVECRDDLKFTLVKKFVELARQKYPSSDILDIDGARIKAHGGWGLIRASNTGPLLVLRFEAPSQSQLKQIRDEFAELIGKIDSSVKVPVLA
ncbi:MAG: phosphomannomutase/phosphoglucomutase [Bdellovibrionales bacterium]|nr:phosphomannomutase/phosphoglucomutase [Bdellovibrionales bacterium]